MNASIPRTISAITRMRLWSRRVGLKRKLAVSLMLAAVISGLATVALMSGSSPLGLDPELLIGLLYLDVVLLLVVGVVVAWRVASIWWSAAAEWPARGCTADWYFCSAWSP